MPKQQTRIVLAEAVTPIAEEIKTVTGASSLSEVLTLLLTRYGPHIVEWWKSNPHSLEGLQPVESSPAAIAPIPSIDLSTPIDF